MNPGHRSRRLATLAIASLALPLVRAPGRPAGQQPDPGRLATVLPGDPEDSQVEYFVLEEPVAPGPQADLGEEPCGELRQVGLACWRRLVVDGGPQLEWDVVFPDQDTRVLHTERWTEAGVRLVWRELRPGSGRSLSAECLEEGTGLRVREWAGRFRRAEALEAPGPFVLPIQLLELARRGALPPEGVWVFDPVGRTFERVVCRPPPPGVEADRRRVDLVREDGTSAGSWLFEGTRLEAFRWQDGDLVARQIPAEDYHRRLRPAPGPAEVDPAPVRTPSGM